MKKLITAVILLMTAVGAGCKSPPKPQVTECRFRAFDPDTKGMHIGDWTDCTKVENTEEFIFESLDHPGLIIWTEEHTKQGRKWSDPVTHTKPRILPEDNFDVDGRANS